MRTSFREIKEKLIAADNVSMQDWRLYNSGSIEDYMTFTEHRRSLLSGAVSAILSELIAREEDVRLNCGAILD